MATKTELRCASCGAAGLLESQMMDTPTVSQDYRGRPWLKEGDSARMCAHAAHPDWCPACIAAHLDSQPA